MSLIVYFSSSSENTHRFVQRLGLPAVRIPLNERERIRRRTLHSHRPQLWRRRHGGRGPRQAIRFLNDPHNRQLIRGVTPRATAILARPMAGLATSSSRNAAYRISIVLS